MCIHTITHTSVVGEIRLDFFFNQSFSILLRIFFLSDNRVSELETIFEIYYPNQFTNDETKYLRKGGCLAKSLVISARMSENQGSWTLNSRFSPVNKRTYGH